MPPTNQTVTRLIDTRMAGNEPSQPVMSLIRRVRRVLWSRAPAERTALVSSIDVLLPMLRQRTRNQPSSARPSPAAPAAMPSTRLPMTLTAAAPRAGRVAST